MDREGSIPCNIVSWLHGICPITRGILKGGPHLADRAETADHIHQDATDRYAPSLQALLLFARPIVTIGDLYYCVVLTNLNVISNGITCIYKILEINLKC